MPAGSRRGSTTWRTDVATPPTLASMTKQPKKEEAGKATNLGEFNSVMLGKRNLQRKLHSKQSGWNNVMKTPDELTASARQMGDI